MGHILYCEVCSQAWVKLDKVSKGDTHYCTMCMENDLVDGIKRSFTDSYKGENLDCGN